MIHTRAKRPTKAKLLRLTAHWTCRRFWSFKQCYFGLRITWACDSPGYCAVARLLMQLEIFVPASAKFRNQLAFKHSSRSRPLKLSTWPFCIGRPG